MRLLAKVTGMSMPRDRTSMNHWPELLNRCPMFGFQWFGVTKCRGGKVLSTILLYRSIIKFRARYEFPSIQWTKIPVLKEPRHQSPARFHISSGFGSKLKRGPWSYFSPQANLSGCARRKIGNGTRRGRHQVVISAVIICTLTPNERSDRVDS
ncbi:hypothetical protein V2G26_009853 [Clonostachys chloroleuca]